MTRWSNLVTGRAARLPGDYSPNAAPAPRNAAGAKPVAQVGILAALVLPWSPSVNHYYRRHGHTIHVSTAGKKFAKEVAAIVGTREPIADRVSVLIELFAPDRRHYDVDNRIKALLDSLTKAGLWVDDKQVRDLRIVDRGIVNGGRVQVRVYPLEAGYRQECH